MMVASAMAAINYDDYVVIQNGDDNIIFVKTMIDLQTFVGHMLDMGQELVCQHRTPQQYNLLEYCSSRAWDVGGDRVIVGKVGRVLAKMFVTTKKVDVERHMYEVALGLRHYTWVPVLGVVIQSVLNGCYSRKVKALNTPKNPYQIYLRREIEVDEAVAYQFFEDVYGFDARVLERVLSNVDFSQPGKAYTHPLIQQIMDVDGVLTDEDCLH